MLSACHKIKIVSQLRQGWVNFKKVVLRQGWWAGGEDKEGGSNHNGIRQKKVSRKVIVQLRLLGWRSKGLRKCSDVSVGQSRMCE